MPPRSTDTFFHRYKVALSIIGVLFLLYYWNGIRPARITNGCMAEASASAKVLLENKAKAATDPEQRTSYQNLIDRGMYLRSDYESYYKKCLRSHGVFI